MTNEQRKYEEILNIAINIPYNKVLNKNILVKRT